MTTKDFATYSKAALLYDGGFCAIDGTITKRGDRYHLVANARFPELGIVQ